MKRIIQLFCVLLAVYVCWLLWYNMSLRPVNTADQSSIIVRIPSGTSSAKVAQILEDQGVVRSHSAFSLYTRFHGQQTSLKAGSFVLKPSMTAEEITNVLTNGVAEETIITIPEGYTVADIDALMVDKGLSKPGDIIACAKTCDFSFYTFLPKAAASAPGGTVEGYLFPDTYFIIRDTFTPESFIRRLLDTFQKRVVQGLSSEIATQKHSLAGIMTMASLIEKETRGDSERPVVSGILWKRFDKGMRLDVDATVRYALGKPKGALTATDLQSDSPYNLRKQRGLTPGPIANPGIESIKAALAPTASDYWYYLHGSDGVIHYARTNDEQNENRARYL